MIANCHAVYKSFNEQSILKDISFHIEDHEKVALVGNNGAGKTTLFRYQLENLHRITVKFSLQNVFVSATLNRICILIQAVASMKSSFMYLMK